MRRLILLAGFLALVGVCGADKMLIPVSHVEVGALCDALLRSPVFIPKGVDRIWPLADGDAIVAEGDADAIGQLREVVLLLDHPINRVAADIREVRLPVASPDPMKVTEALEALGNSTVDGLNQALSVLQTAGAQVTVPRTGAVVLMDNNTPRPVWLSDDLRTIAGPNALAAGLILTPRIMADGVVLSVETVEAQPDDVWGARLVSSPALDVTIEPGHVAVWSQAYMPRADGKRQQVAIVIVLRILPKIQ